MLRMFALLEHTTLAGLHWDLLIEYAPAATLATWRLHSNPLEEPLPVVAERLADHRSVYLAYEGPIGGDRGVVRRIDRGEATIVFDGTAARITLDGEHLRGLFTIREIDRDLLLDRAP